MSALDTLLGSNPVIYGRNTVIGTTIEELYETSQIFNWLGVMTAETVMEAASTSTADAAAGTGARKIKVYGINTALALVSEILTLNGQTKVVGTIPMRLPLGYEVIETGTGGTNAGVIDIAKAGTTFTTGSAAAATCLGRMPATFSETMMGIYVVPAGKTARIDYVRGISRTQGATLLLCSQTIGSDIVNRHGIALELGANTSYQSMQEVAGLEFPAGTIIRLRAIGAAASAAVTGHMKLSVRTV